MGLLFSFYLHLWSRCENYLFFCLTVVAATWTEVLYKQFPPKIEPVFDGGLQVEEATQSVTQSESRSMIKFLGNGASRGGDYDWHQRASFLSPRSRLTSAHLWTSPIDWTTSNVSKPLKHVGISSFFPVHSAVGRFACFIISEGMFLSYYIY